MDEPTQSKSCSGCKIVKPLTDFGKDAQHRDGLTSRCKPCRAIQCRAYAETDAGRASTKHRNKRWADRNRDLIAELNRVWRQDHPGYSAEHNRLWREANPGAQSAYHQANREKAMERVQRRRNRVKVATVGEIDLRALWLFCEGICALCGDSIDFDLAHPDPLSKSVDHIVPLSKGGTHEQSNLQWTHLVCNIRKGARAPLTQ